MALLRAPRWLLKVLFFILLARKKARAINMLETSLSQLEALVSELLQANQALLSRNAQLTAELAQARDDSDNLQLSALEQDEVQNATVARIQALVERVSASNLAVSA
jgi:cell division protein ZapB